MHVAQLSTTPIKSLNVHHPESVDLVAGGVVGDRVFYLVDDAGVIVNCTAVGDLLKYRAEFDSPSDTLEIHGPDGLLKSGPVEPGDSVDTDFYGLRVVRGWVVTDWSEVFSEITGRSVRLVRGETGGFDVHGVTLLGASSVDQLATSSEVGPVDPRRFRMNVEIAGSQSLDEDSWDGRHLRIGSAMVAVGGMVKRCATTTRDPDSGEVDLKTLELIGKVKGRQETSRWGAGFYLGVYADVVEPGRVALGDTVELL